MLTLNQAKQHLDGVRKLCIETNIYLSCVRDYLMTVELDICQFVRADTITDYTALQDLLNEQNRVNALVKDFLRGVL